MTRPWPPIVALLAPLLLLVWGCGVGEGDAAPGGAVAEARVPGGESATGDGGASETPAPRLADSAPGARRYSLPVPPPPGDSVALQVALDSLQALVGQGGWGTVPSGGTLRPGDRDARVPALRRRLEWFLSGRPEGPQPPDPLLFDAELESAVRAFQAQHALDVDGVVGGGTLGALNVDVERRIRQIRMNLDERRAFVDATSRTRIVVNIPAFTAWVMEEGAAPREHRVIVGRTDRPTPLVEGRVAHVVLAPYWNVPPNILTRDKLPVLRRDPGYLERQNMTVMSRATGAPVDPGSIDWNSIGAGEFNRSYWLRQAPGPGNALGMVKFIFPNVFDVYLHDTPDRHLFQRGRRAFSSGCVRLEGAMELAERLLGPVPGWGVDRTRAAAGGRVETWVPLPEPVAIRAVYWTAWVDASGALHLGDDLYGLDARRATTVSEGMSECAQDLVGAPGEARG